MADTTEFILLPSEGLRADMSTTASVGAGRFLRTIEGFAGGGSVD
jgi:hypothetical protein